MKIIKDENGTKVILGNHDVLEVATEKEKYKVVIKCLGETLHLEEENDINLDYIIEEQKAIKTMDDYLKEHENDQNA